MPKAIQNFLKLTDGEKLLWYIDKDRVYLEPGIAIPRDSVAPSEPKKVDVEEAAPEQKPVEKKPKS